MKYGYMNYRKHLLSGKKERPMNLGDPIQSFAVLEFFKRIGISDDEIIPLDRYDLADYDGEEVIAVINGAENYEHYAYATRFLPVSDKIHPVFLSIHLDRDISENELKSLRDNQPIGCRDEYTVDLLKEKGIDAFLTGCFTMLFPRRDPNGKYEKVFIVDCSDETLTHIPDVIMKDAECLTQVIRLNSTALDYKLTLDETEKYNNLAKQQLDRYKNEAKLVITSRLHVACPCAAMGIPVILVRNSYDVRYKFIDRFLKLYYPEELDNLDWNTVRAEIPEQVKDKLTSLGKYMLEIAKLRLDLCGIYSNKSQCVEFISEEGVALGKLPLCSEDKFDFCIWGVCMPNSYLLYEQMKEQYPKARMRYAIDTYATGIYKDNIRIIHPDKIENLLKNETWILVVAPAAHKDASRLLENKYNYALIKGTSCDVHEI